MRNADLAVALYAAVAYWLFWRGLSDSSARSGREQAAAAVFGLAIGPIILAGLVVVAVVNHFVAGGH